MKEEHKIMSILRIKYLPALHCIRCNTVHCVHPWAAVYIITTQRTSRVCANGRASSSRYKALRVRLNQTSERVKFNIHLFLVTNLPVPSVEEAVLKEFFFVSPPIAEVSSAPSLTVRLVGFLWKAMSWKWSRKSKKAGHQPDRGSVPGCIT